MAATMSHRVLFSRHVHRHYSRNVLRSSKTLMRQLWNLRESIRSVKFKYFPLFSAKRMTTCRAVAGLGLAVAVAVHAIWQQTDLLEMMPTVFAAAPWSADNNAVSNSHRFNFIADVVEKAAPAVVYIEIKGRVPFHTGLSTVSNGSGFVVEEDGLILTNAHVVANKQVVVVQLQDGRSFEGQVQAVDPISDLATVKINCKGLSTLKLGDSSQIRPGEWVIAMGSPLSLSNTVTAGIVSTVHRGSQELGLHNRDMGYIQTDAVINFGNSGGPLVNLDGEAIGINTMKVTTGISFAIPSDYARDFLQKAEKLQKSVKSKGWFGTKSNKRRYIGITMLTLTPAILMELRQRVANFPDIEQGVLVHKVVVGSPAHSGGILPGDVVVGINGEDVKSSSDVYNAIESVDSLQLKVRRGQETLLLHIRSEQVD